MHSDTCTQCCTPVTDEHTLCASCELRFALTLLRLAASITPLHDMLDDITGHAYELRRVLLGMPDPDHEAADEDVIGTLTIDAGAPNLSTHPCAGMYMRVALRLMQATDLLLDPPDLHDIGHCLNPLCGVMIQARDGQSTVTCPVCATTTDTRTIRLRTLERLCWDDERRGSAAQIARVFANCGIPVRANTIRQWAKRGKLHATGAGSPRPAYRYSDVYRLTVGMTRSY